MFVNVSGTIHYLIITMYSDYNFDIRHVLVGHSFINMELFYTIPELSALFIRSLAWFLI